jgi:hypothetical protein
VLDEPLARVLGGDHQHELG